MVSNMEEFEEFEEFEDWDVASFCKSCDHELNEWDLFLKHCCPYCGAHGDRNMIDHYDRHYRLEKISSGFLGFFKKYKRVYDESEEIETA